MTTGDDMNVFDWYPGTGVGPRVQRGTSNRRIRLCPIIVASSFLVSSCALFEPSERPAPAPPPPVIIGDIPNPGAVQTRLPTPSLSDAERLRQAINLLEQGLASRAKAELEAYLRVEPESAVAKRLLFQIEAPLEVLFPPENFIVTLAPNETLSSLSGRYLGEVLGFYALARYNGIDNPARVSVGQAIKIPATASALATRDELASTSLPEFESEQSDDVWAPIADYIAAGRYGIAIREAEVLGLDPVGEHVALLAEAYAGNARALQTANPLHAGTHALRAGQLYLEASRPRDALGVLELAVALTPGSTAARALRGEARRVVVDTEYREGVEAFQRRQLDDAIAHWERALEIDPDHRDARINRAQAIELKSGNP